MAKKARDLAVRHHKVLTPQRCRCPVCAERMWLDYTNHRTVLLLDGLTRLDLAARRRHNAACAAHLRPYRPEAEGRFAPPHHEFGLDVIALIGALRYAEHRTVPEIHRLLLQRGLSLAQRSVTNLLDRYDELLAVALTGDRRLQKLLANQGRVILAIDGLQPDVGHEVLWVIRDCLSGEVLLAKSLLSGREQDPAGLLTEVRDAVGVPVVGAASDGQHSSRNAIARGAAPAVPVPLPARGRPADLRGRPPRQEGAEEAGAAGARHRAGGGRAYRPRSRRDPRLLRRGAQRLDRRRPAAAGGVGAEAARPPAGGRREPRPGRGKRGARRAN